MTGKKSRFWRGSVIAVALTIALNLCRPSAAEASSRIVSFSGEMARFYSAVAVVTYWDCVQKQDPTRCQAFVRSLKDLNTYAGFGLFVLGARTTGLATHHLTRGRSSGNYLGMAAGLLVSELYQEFIAHPKTQELLAATDYQKRKQIVRELWQDSLANQEWWNDKVPSILSLLAGARITSATIPVLIKGLHGSEIVVDLSHARLAKKAASSSIWAARTAKLLRSARTALQEYRGVVNGLTKVAEINPYLWITGQIGELILFTKFSDWVEAPTRKWWYERQFSSQLKEKKDALEANPNSAQAVGEVEAAWDQLRTVNTLEAKSIQALYLEEISYLDRQLMTPYFYYTWIARGMKADDPIIQDNPFQWKPENKAEIQDYIRSFFCGPSPEKAVQRALLVMNLPVPGRSQDKIVPYRVTPKSNVCEFQGLSGEGDTVTQAKYHERRMALLAQNDYRSAVEAAQNQVIQLSQPIREDLITRYQQRLAESLLKALGPGESTILNQLEEEESYWQSWERKAGRKTPAFRAALTHIQSKKAAIQELVQYIHGSSEKQNAFEEELFADDTDTETVSLDQWKKFMLHPGEATQP